MITVVEKEFVINLMVIALGKIETKNFLEDYESEKIFQKTISMLRKIPDKEIVISEEIEHNLNDLIEKMGNAEFDSKHHLTLTTGLKVAQKIIVILEERYPQTEWFDVQSPISPPHISTL